MVRKAGKSLAAERYEQSFRKGSYKGLDISKIPIREGSLDILMKPSRIGSKLYPYKSVFNRGDK